MGGWSNLRYKITVTHLRHQSKCVRAPCSYITLSCLCLLYAWNVACCHIPFTSRADVNQHSHNNIPS